MPFPDLPNAPSLPRGGGRSAIFEPKPWNRDERIIWALRRGVERAAGKRITQDEALQLLISISAPDTSFGFTVGFPEGALEATRDYTVSLLDFLKSVLRFYKIVYDPRILVSTLQVWTTLPGSVERSEQLEKIAVLLVKDHPEVAEAIRWIPVLEVAIKEFLEWLKTNDALLEVASVLGEGIAEFIGKEIGTLMKMSTSFEQGQFLGRTTGYVITTVLLEVLAF